MLDFPSTPALGDTYTSGEVAWTWDGSKWISSGLLNSYLPISGGTLTGPLVGTDATFSGDLSVDGTATAGTLAVGMIVPTSPPLNYDQAFLQEITLPGGNAIRFNLYVTPAGPANVAYGDGPGAIIYADAGGLEFNVGASVSAGDVVSSFGVMTLDYNGNLTPGGGLYPKGQSVFPSVGGLGQSGFGQFVMSAQPGNDAFMTFIVNDYFACQFGLSSNGYYYTGGWSFGSGVVYQFWTSRDFANPACDYRIKTNIKPLGSTWELVKELRPISYQQKEFSHRNAPKGTRPVLEADDRERWGFVAHELQDALGETAAHCPKDDPNHLQAPNMIMLVATLTKTIQEMQTRIEALEARF